MEDENNLGESINDLSSNRPVVHTETLKLACSQLLNMYLDEEYFKLGHEVGTRLRWGELEAMGVLNDVPDEHQIVNTPGTDIFGNLLSKQYNFQCECPKCHRTMAASRYTPHLERCMGMGRNSSRTASRRLAGASSNANNNNNNSNNASSDSSKNAGQESSSSGPSQDSINGESDAENNQFEEEDDDEDWLIEKKKKTKKSKNTIANKRKGSLSRVRNTENVGSKRRGGATPSVTDSPPPLLLGASESCIYDEDELPDLSIV